MEIKDFFGQPLDIGDQVIYATGKELRRAEVVGVTKFREYEWNTKSYTGKIHFTVQIAGKVKRSRYDYGERKNVEKEETVVSRLKTTNRLFKVPAGFTPAPPSP